jgi:hypothetical protein
MRDCNYLFSNADWYSVDQNQRKELVEEIDGINGDRLLNTSVDDLCDYFENKYQIDVPVLRPENIVADQRKTKIDVSGDPNRYFRNPGQQLKFQYHSKAMPKHSKYDPPATR